MHLIRIFVMILLVGCSKTSSESNMLAKKESKIYQSYQNDDIRKFSTFFSPLSYYFQTFDKDKIVNLIIKDNQKKSVKFLKILLGAGWNPSSSVFVDSIKYGNLDVLKFFQKKKKINFSNKIGGSYPLEIATTNNQFEIFKYLIEKHKVKLAIPLSIKNNKTAKTEKKPLPYCLFMWKKFDYLKVLIKNGYDFYLPNYGKKNSFLELLLINKKDVTLDFLLYLFENFEKLKKISSKKFIISLILYISVVEDKIEIYEKFLKKSNTLDFNHLCLEFFYHIIEHKKKKYFEILVKNHLIFHEDEFIQEILQTDDPEYFKIIKKQYPDIDFNLIKIKNPKEYDPKEVRKHFLETGLQLQTSKNISLVQYCYEFGKKNIFRYLAQNKLNLDIVYGDIPLLTNFILNNDFNYLLIALENGANIHFQKDIPKNSIIEAAFNSKSAHHLFNAFYEFIKSEKIKNLEQPLINDLYKRAFFKNKIQLLSSLAKFKPEINKLTDEKRTPLLSLAIKKNSFFAVREFLKNGADPFKVDPIDNQTAVEQAAELESSRILIEILKCLTLEQKDKLPIKKIIKAAYNNNNFWTLDFLIQHKLIKEADLSKYFDKSIFVQSVLDDKPLEFIENLL